jgi:hypothetical protein
LFVPLAVTASVLGFTPAGPAQGATKNYSVVRAAPKAGGGEPSIATDPTNDDRVYISYPGNSMYLYRSDNGGQTWIKGGEPQDFSGDTSVNVDTSGAVYESNLGGQGIEDTLQADVFKSFNHGKTFPQHGDGFAVGSNTTNQPFLVDRQWTDTNIPKGKTTKQGRVYITYHDWAPSQIWVNVSKDGGKTFGPPIDVITNPPADPDAIAASAQAEQASACDTIPGGVKVVPTNAPASKHPGRVYVAWLAGDLATNAGTGCNVTQLQTFHTIWVAWSDDEGDHWTPHLVFDAGPMHDASALFADFTVDRVGNPYVAFGMNLYDSETTDMFVEGSFDNGVTWNGKSDGTGAPYRVNIASGPRATKTNVFPAIAAGDPGKVDVAYVGTSANVPELATGKVEPGGVADALWDVYVAQSLNLKSGTPTFSVTKVTDKAIHKGDICVLGIFCVAPQSDRNLLDFIDIAVDTEGFSHTAFTADYKDGLRNGIYVANQTGGTRVLSG